VLLANLVLIVPRGFTVAVSAPTLFVKVLGVSIDASVGAVTLRTMAGEDSAEVVAGPGVLHGLPYGRRLRPNQEQAGCQQRPAMTPAYCVPGRPLANSLNYWRTRKDSNLRPLPSEGSALSS
jgi:hypothetical protein